MGHVEASARCSIRSFDERAQCDFPRSRSPTSRQSSPHARERQGARRSAGAARAPGAPPTQSHSRWRGTPMKELLAALSTAKSLDFGARASPRADILCQSRAAAAEFRVARTAARRNIYAASCSRPISRRPAEYYGNDETVGGARSVSMRSSNVSTPRFEPRGDRREMANPRLQAENCGLSPDKQCR